MEHCSHLKAGNRAAAKRPVIVIERMTGRCLLALLFLFAFLPHGSVFGVNVKVLAVLGFIPVFVLYLVEDPRLLSYSDMIFLAVACGFLLFWTLLGVLKGQAGYLQVLSELQAVSTTIFTAWLGWFGIRRGMVRTRDVILTIILAIFTLELLKLVLVGESLAYGVNPVYLIEDVFGKDSLVTGGIGFGFVRIQFPPDILAPFVLFALLMPEVSGVRLAWPLSLLISLVLVLSGIITFARYNWIAFAVAALAALISRQRWKTLAATVAVTALVIVLTGTSSQEVLYRRFSSASATASDNSRIRQARALLADFEGSPFIGRGLGGHDNTIIRDPKLRYSYEMQWLALLMQFGLVGFAGILLLIGATARDLVKAKHPARFWVALLFLVWLVAPFTNPYITTSFAGVAFVLFLAMFRRMRYNPQTARG